MTPNPFVRTISRKRDQELLDILDNRGNYEEGAVLVAAMEIKRRGIDFEGIDQILLDLSNKVEVQIEKERQANRFFSKNTIYGLSAVFTPLLIGPLMAYNIWEAGERKGLLIVIVLTILYPALIFTVLFFGIPPILLGITHFAYTAIFVELLWRKYIPRFEDQNQKEPAD